MTKTHLSLKILVLGGTALMLTRFQTGMASYDSILSSIAVRQYALCGHDRYCLYVWGTLYREEIHVEHGAVGFLADDGERGPCTASDRSFPPDKLVALGGLIVAYVLRKDCACLVEVERVVAALRIRGLQILHAVLFLLGEDHLRPRAQA
jgi:hypothetical protein